MGEKIVVGPVSRGSKKDLEPFYINNDSFPTLLNAYQWRGRIKRKRGTSFLNRLTRYFDSTKSSYGSITSFNLVAGAGNLITGFGLQSGSSIVPGTVTFTDSTSGKVYTDPAEDGTLSGTAGGSGTINYATGAITIVGGAADTINTATFEYTPNLPVMGLEDLVLQADQFPGNLAFDTTNAYNIVLTYPYPSYNVSFYKNPASSGSYVQKTNPTPVKWNGQNYQQFWTVNYENALWATNGITVPFVSTNIGMQFKPIITVTVLTATTATLQITGHGLVVGDFVFVNEVITTTGINFQTGYVTTVTNANNVIVTFPNAALATNGTLGIAQYLTSSANTAKDCIRWYDGDPTNGSPTTPVLNGTKGWVNFSPPLTNGPDPTFVIDDLPSAQYYLIGARMVFPYKDRLLFIGPVVQSSATGPFYLQDTIIYSQNGTPYYTASFTSATNPTYTTALPIDSTTVFIPLIVPTNQTATPSSYFEDVTGFGGFITAGLSQPIVTVSPNQDVLILGATNKQIKLVYTGNDVLPFNLFIINSELGSASTFSVITLDRGVLSVGPRGIIIADQVSSARIDLEIPDQVFQINLTNNGPQRTTAQRDFINEWIYFTYTANDEQATDGSSQIINVFPNETLFYNYRDETWGIFDESYTTYGQFRPQTGYSWSTLPYNSWNEWTSPWNAGQSTQLQPQVIGGNQQGFVMLRTQGTEEDPSLFIQSISGIVITSPNHGLSNGDFIIISGCLGTVKTELNNNIYAVSNVTQNTLDISASPAPSGTYLGGGVITRMYVPLIQTKQFPTAWGLARKTRIGPQMYLLTGTTKAQITLQIYLSQNSGTPFNFPPYVPDINSQNNAVIYSDILYTCPESTNLGLTPQNINLQQIVPNQQQIWHRMNTSLIGDTVQIGFTLSDEQMLTVDDEGKPISQFAEIELHGLILDVAPSQALA